MENESKKHLKTIKTLIEQKKELDKVTEKMQKQQEKMISDHHFRNKKKQFRKENDHTSIKLDQNRFSYLPKRSQSAILCKTNNSRLQESKAKVHNAKDKKKTEKILQSILKSKIKEKSTTKPKEMKKNSPKRRSKSPQQLYDALNRKGNSVSIKEYKNSKFAPEPFKPKPDEVQIFESQSVQTPVSMKRGSKTLSDRIDYYRCFKNSKLKRRSFNLWLSKWSRSEIQHLRKELKLAIENKKVEVAKKSKNSSSDSDDLPPLYDDNS